MSWYSGYNSELLYKKINSFEHQPRWNSRKKTRTINTIYKKKPHIKTKLISSILWSVYKVKMERFVSAATPCKQIIKQTIRLGSNPACKIPLLCKQYVPEGAGGTSQQPEFAPETSNYVSLVIRPARTLPTPAKARDSETTRSVSTTVWKLDWWRKLLYRTTSCWVESHRWMCSGEWNFCGEYWIVEWVIMVERMVICGWWAVDCNAKMVW